MDSSFIFSELTKFYKDTNAVAYVPVRFLLYH